MSINQLEVATEVMADLRKLPPVIALEITHELKDDYSPVSENVNE